LDPAPELSYDAAPLPSDLRILDIMNFMRHQVGQSTSREPSGRALTISPPVKP
jgi:hypothetical protein